MGIPVPEAAASHWLTWALGAVAVEATFGLIQLPKWCRNLWIGGLAIVLASATSLILPVTQKDTVAHDFAWMLMHRRGDWDSLFSLIVPFSRALVAGTLRTPRIVTCRCDGRSLFVFLYLTHELVIMQSWFVLKDSNDINTLLVSFLRLSVRVGVL